MTAAELMPEWKIVSNQTGKSWYKVGAAIGMSPAPIEVATMMRFMLPA